MAVCAVAALLVFGVLAPELFAQSTATIGLANGSLKIAPYAFWLLLGGAALVGFERYATLRAWYAGKGLLCNYCNGPVMEKNSPQGVHAKCLFCGRKSRLR